VKAKTGCFAVLAALAVLAGVPLLATLWIAL